MRQEDKEVDGYEIEHAEERKRHNELVRDDDARLYDLDGKPESLVRDEARTSVVAGAVRSILEHEHLVIDTLPLEKRELRALEALRTAAEGRDQVLDRFVYAEDRQTLLEQALAVLQPELAELQQEDRKQFGTLIREVAELRQQLRRLAASQTNARKPRAKDVAAATGGDEDDKPDDDDTSLTGPERAIEKPPSSLAGPERAEAPKPPTTLGDPAEIAAAAATPWWRRGE